MEKTKDLKGDIAREIMQDIIKEKEEKEEKSEQAPTIERVIYSQFSKLKQKQHELQKKLEEVGADERFSQAYKQNQSKKLREELIKSKIELHAKVNDMIDSEKQFRENLRIEPRKKGLDGVLEALEKNNTMLYINSIIKSNSLKQDEEILNIINDNKNDSQILNMIKANTSSQTILSKIIEIESEKKNLDNDLHKIKSDLYMIEKSTDVMCIGIEPYVDKMIIAKMEI